MVSNHRSPLRLLGLVGGCLLVLLPAGPAGAQTRIIDGDNEPLVTMCGIYHYDVFRVINNATVEVCAYDNVSSKEDHGNLQIVAA